MIRLLVPLFALAALSSSNADPEDEPPFFSISLKQEGRVIPISDGEAVLKPAAFEIVVHMRKAGGIMLDVSEDTGTFAALRGTDLLDEVPELQYGKALAEDSFNPDEDLFVEQDGFNFLYVKDEKEHRFSSVRKDADGWTCIRKVSAFTTSHDESLESVPVSRSHYEVLHFAFVRPRRFQTLRGEIEVALQKELVTLRFRK